MSETVAMCITGAMTIDVGPDNDTPGFSEQNKLQTAIASIAPVGKGIAPPPVSALVTFS